MDRSGAGVEPGFSARNRQVRGRSKVAGLVRSPVNGQRHRSPNLVVALGPGQEVNVHSWIGGHLVVDVVAYLTRIQRVTPGCGVPADAFAVISVGDRQGAITADTSPARCYHRRFTNGTHRRAPRRRRTIPRLDLLMRRELSRRAEALGLGPFVFIGADDEWPSCAGTPDCLTVDESIIP